MDTGTDEGPGPLRLHAMAYDPVRDELVLFGGIRAWNASDLNPETWLWDEEGWRLASPAGGVAPVARYGHDMVWDPVSEEILLFGGGSAGGTGGDLWTWNGERWAVIEPEDGIRPPVRHYGTLAYDSARDRILLFGGFGNAEPGCRRSHHRCDLWAWDRERWTLVEPEDGVHPPAVYWHAMTYDPIRARTVVHGGQGEEDAFWSWDGHRWQPVTFAGTGPPARARHVLMHQPASDRLLLFGGQVDSAVSDATWEFDVGSTARPGGLLEVDWRTAFIPAGSEALGFHVHAVAGGEGSTGDAALDGAELRLWHEGRWLTVDAHTGHTGAPAPLAHTVTDPQLLSGLRTRDRSFVSVVPVGESSHDAARVAVDYIEAHLRYRLPSP